jgi:hypothetical protein
MNWILYGLLPNAAWGILYLVLHLFWKRLKTFEEENSSLIDSIKELLMERRTIDITVRMDAVMTVTALLSKYNRLALTNASLALLEGMIILGVIIELRGIAELVSTALLGLIFVLTVLQANHCAKAAGRLEYRCMEVAGDRLKTLTTYMKAEIEKARLAGKQA